MRADLGAQQAFLLAAGKTNLGSSGDKFNKMLGFLDYAQQIWSVEDDWDSLFDNVNIGQVTTSTAGYALPATVNRLTKYKRPVTIVHASNQTTEYDVVSATTFAQNPSPHTAAVRRGRLYFSDVFAVDSPQLKGKIIVPAVLEVTRITKGSDLIVVDDPRYAITLAASLYARDSITKASKAPGLQDQANELMQAMKDANGGQDSDYEREPVVLGQTW